MRTPRVGIIGAGMSGIGMAAKLRMAGIDSFHLYEQWPDFGGTWQANTYPGLFCDIPSRYYQYTFAPNPDWSSVYPAGPEIAAYLRRVAAEYRVREQTSFSTKVREVEWVDGEWLLRTEDGREDAYDFIVTACGGLVHTRKPPLPGLQDFGGAVFHSAEWDHSVPLEGRRIGVIGTGSTGMQITRALAPVAGRYELYQRTPQWVFPLGNREYSERTKRLYARFPGLSRWAYRGFQLAFETLARAPVEDGIWRRLVNWGCERHLQRVKDPALRERLRPTDAPMCKRMIMGTGFYELFELPHVDLVDAGIDHICEQGIVTADGVLHELDVIVLATGFDAHAFVRPVEFIGPEGNRLSELWAVEPFAYRTVALPGFPNVLMLIGPHSPFGNQSLFTISETQMDYAMQAIDLWRRGVVDALAPTAEATARFNDELTAAVPNTIWASGCQSWYIGANGLPHAWPWIPKRHRELLRAIDLRDFELVPGPAVRREPVAVP